jgi:uncharacterized protein (UPF0332 family)
MILMFQIQYVGRKFGFNHKGVKPKKHKGFWMKFNRPYKNGSKSPARDKIFLEKPVNNKSSPVRDEITADAKPNGIYH